MKLAEVRRDRLLKCGSINVKNAYIYVGNMERERSLYMYSNFDSRSTRIIEGKVLLKKYLTIHYQEVHCIPNIVIIKKWKRL